MLDPIGIIKIAETKGVAMTDRFSKLYKESAVAKKLSRNFHHSYLKQKRLLQPEITELLESKFPRARIKVKFLVIKRQTLKRFKFL